MKNLDSFNSKIKYLLTDIDDTLTEEGQLHADAYSALWDLKSAGIKIIPITGRPAGWCEMIARMWPVDGIVGENGGFYFRYHDKSMKREFVFNEQIRQENRKKLNVIEQEILTSVPGSAIASDQFCRLMDLAVDFCEDVPDLEEKDIEKIVSIFEKHGAQAKVSSIHVNGWFGKYDKLTMALHFLQKEYGVSAEEAKKVCAFSGDSPNDEPMFSYFPHSFAVANIQNFISKIKNPPTYVSKATGGKGFAQISEAILKQLR